VDNINQLLLITQVIDYLEKGKVPEEKNVITGTILVTPDNVKEIYNPESVF